MATKKQRLLAKRALAGAALCAALLPTCRKDNPSENVFTGMPPVGSGAGAGGGSSATGGSASSSGGTSASGRGGAGNSTGGGTDSRGGSDGSGARPAAGGSGGAGSGTGAGAGGTGNVGEGGTTFADAGQSANGGDGNQGEGGSGAEGGVPGETVPFTKTGLLQSIAECSVAEYERFLSLAEDLAEEAALARDVPSAPAEAAVRQAFLVAMASFQRVEVLRFGPAARSSEEPAGRDLRDQIYAWRLGGRCNVDTELLAEGYLAPDFPTASLINVRGLGTAEYLLFYPTPDNGCPAYFPMNANGTWAALGADTVWARRRAYAAVVSEAIAARARELVDAWDPASQNFFTAFTSAGADESPYASQQAALNAVSNALFYVEKEVKDYKLGIPLALSPECAQTTCPEALESQFAHISTENIAHNLDGFSRLFRGCGQSGVRALGFDDWLVAVGAADLSDRMLAALAGAEQAAANLDPPIELSLVDHTDRVRGVYDAVKALTDLLKTEFVTVLDLELPKASEGDND